MTDDATHMDHPEERWMLVRAATRRVNIRRIALRGSLVLCALAPGGCVIAGTVGDDPRTTGNSDDEGVEATSTDSVGTIGQTSASVSETSGVSQTSTTGLDEPGALEFCGVPPVVEPGPGDPTLFEFIECGGGCEIELETVEPIGLLDYGDCLCAALVCGPLSGGGVGGFPGTGTTTVATTGPDVPAPGDCGPFPPGEESLVCECESCSVDIVELDEQWLGQDADITEICTCACNSAGCGMPLPSE